MKNGGVGVLRFQLFRGPLRWRQAIFAGSLVLLLFVAGVFTLSYLAPERSSEPLVLAFAGGVSSTSPTSGGRTELDAVRLLVNEVNQAGGVNGRQVALEIHDDHDNPENAQDIAYSIGQRGSAVAVIGHNGSATALAAAPVYARFGVPAITPSATHDALTASGWYFRTIFNNSFQARFIARYARYLLGRNDGILVATSDVYSNQIADTVGRAAVDVGLDVRKRWQLSNDDKAANTKAANEIATFLAEQAPDAVVFLMARADLAKEVLIAIRDRGLTNSVIGPDILGRPSFFNSFGDQAKEKQSPGFYTSGLLVTMPLIFELAPAAALAFRDRFERVYGYSPPWEAALAYDAGAMVLKGATDLKLLGGNDSVRREREAMRGFLAGLNSPANAFQGIAGPVFFEAGGDPKKPISMGIVQNRIISPLSQLAQIANPGGLRDLDGKLARHEVVRFDDEYLYRNTIVYTGVKPTGAWTIDPDGSRFTAEFDLWFRYYGDAPVADIVFTNATQPITLGEPVKSYAVQGLNYRLYRVSGTFKLDSAEDAIRYGRHRADIVFRNREATSERLVYVPDTQSMPKSAAELTSDFAATGFMIPGAGWTLKHAWFYSDRLAPVGHGEPDALDTSIEHFPISTVTVGLELAETGTRFRRAIALPQPALAVGGAAAALIGLMVLDRMARRRRLARQLLLLPIVAAALALLYLAETALVEHWLPRQAVQVIRATDVALWLVGALAFIAALDRLLWSAAAQLFGRPMSLVVRFLTAALVVLAAGLGIAATVFNQPITVVLIGLGLAASIVGFSVHRNIASLVGGMALYFERTFAVGDQVVVVGHGEGVVEDVNWRATILRTGDGRVISIPNAVIAAAVIERVGAPGAG